MRERLTLEKWGSLFDLQQLRADFPLKQFVSTVEEYTVYLNEDALRSQNDHIALTWLLLDRKSGGLAAYMSLIADAVKLSVTEKELHALDYPFRTVPAMKIAKLAVDASYQEKYQGIGSFMIISAQAIARVCNETCFACRFLTVDADIEHNESVIAFYEKNGFLVNSEIFNKNRKTVSMRKDIYIKSNGSSNSIPLNRPCESHHL
jgi:ribosomal protein S18 acetylase RimI-like enzyme